MTIRAVLLGLFGAMAVCGFTYLNDVVMRQTPLIGNHMPIGVYGGLILFLLLVHPVLARVRRRLCLSGRELAVALTLTLVSCCIPASGLMRNLTAVMVAPYAFTQTQPGWREQGIIDLTPQAMRVDVSVDRDVVIDGFLKGLLLAAAGRGGVGRHAGPVARRPPIYALGAAGEAAVAPLVDALRAAGRDPGLPDDHAWARVRDMHGAGHALGSMGAPAVAPLVELLEDETQWTRANAAFALGEMDSAAGAAVQALIRCLRDDNDRIVRTAAGALGQIGAPAPSAVPDLRPC